MAFKRKRPNAAANKIVKRSKTMALAKKVKRINQVLKEEKKFLYTVATGVSLSFGSPLLQCENIIVQGDDYNNRSGSSIFMDKIDINYDLIYGDLTNFVRVMLVYDKQPNGVAVSGTNVGQILWDPTTSSSVCVSPLSHYFKDRYTILYDRVHSLSQQGPGCLHAKKTITLNKKADYPNTGATTPNTGAIYVIAYSDSAVIPSPTLNWYSKLYFNP